MTDRATLTSPDGRSKGRNTFRVSGARSWRRRRVFIGKNTVYFDKEDLDGFLAELEVLERTLTGTATLRSMSPDEFVLTLKPLDRLGHVMVLVTIGKYMYNGLEDFRVTLSYEIDLAVVSRIRSDFAALAARLG